MPKFVFALIFSISPALAETSLVCEHQTPNLAPFRSLGLPIIGFDYGVVDSQMVIDSQSWSRLKSVPDSRLVQIERLWGLGHKSVRPESSLVGKIAAIHITLDLRSPSLYSVGFWWLGWTGTDGVWHDLMDERSGSRVFTDDFAVLPVSHFQILREDVAKWRTLTIRLKEPIAREKFAYLDFYARTMFNQPLAPKNLLAGTRADSCFFFLFVP